MPFEPEIHQRLLELAHDLLPDDEAAELRARMAADAELARAHAEAEKTACLFAEAARLESPKIALSPPAAGAALEPARPRAAARSAAPAVMPWNRWATGTVAAAAGILLAVSVYGWYYHHAQLAEIGADHLRLQVAGPSALQAGTENHYWVATTTIAGRPVRSSVKLALYSAEGARLLAHTEETGEAGQLRITLPADLKLPQGVRLELAATSDAASARIDAPLSVEPARFAAYLVIDRPRYEPGDTLRFRSVTLSRLGLTQTGPTRVRVEILDSHGATLGGFSQEMTTQQGVAFGAFTLPQRLPPGEYALVARSPGGEFPEQRRLFRVEPDPQPLKLDLEFFGDRYLPGDKVAAALRVTRPDGKPAAGANLAIEARVDSATVFHQSLQASGDGTARLEFRLPPDLRPGAGSVHVSAEDGRLRARFTRRLPIGPGRIEAGFYPEGGRLVAGAANRVYFACRDVEGHPVELSGRIVNRAGGMVARVKTTRRGMGSFSFEPQPGDAYRLQIESPAGIVDQPRLPPASPGKIVLDAGRGVFQGGEPLEFNLRATRVGLPLVASAWCRGVEVGQLPLVARAGANAVAMPLDDDVIGAIRLAVYDYSDSPPQLVAERLVFRHPVRRLQVEIGGARTLAPGPAEFPLAISDEKGRPVRAILGAAAVSRAVFADANAPPPNMAVHFLLGSEFRDLQTPEDWFFYLSGTAEADAALDLLLGTHGGRVRAPASSSPGKQNEKGGEPLLAQGNGLVRPPMMFDNLRQLQAEYKQSLERYRARRARLLDALTTLSLFGGLALLLLAAMLNVLNIASGVRIWAPSLGVALVCLLVGAYLLNPRAGPAAPSGAVAFAPYQPPRATKKSPHEEQASFLALAPQAGEGIAKTSAGESGASALAAAESSAGSDVAGKPRSETIGQAKAAVRSSPLPALEKQADEQKARQGAKDAEGLRSETPDRAAPAGANAEEMGPGGAASLRREAAIQAPSRASTGGGAMPARRAGQPVNKLAPAEQAAGRAGTERLAERRIQLDNALFWEPMIATDASGKASIGLALPPGGPASCRLLVDAHEENGRIGSAEREIAVELPLRLDAKPPAEVSAGDRIELPVVVANEGNRELSVALAAVCGEGLELEGTPQRSISVAAGAERREYFVVQATKRQGVARLTIQAFADGYPQTLHRTLRIVPTGCPQTTTQCGLLEGSREISVCLPEKSLPATLEASLEVYPSMLAELEKGLARIAASTAPPAERAVWAARLACLGLRQLEAGRLANPDLLRRLKEPLRKSLATLERYRNPDGGYALFDGQAADPALTARVLSLFQELAAVYPLEPAWQSQAQARLSGWRDRQGGSPARPDKTAGEKLADAWIAGLLAEANRRQAIDAGLLRLLERWQEASNPPLGVVAASALRTDGRLTIKRGDEILGEARIRAAALDAVSVAGLERKLRPGENKLSLVLEGGARLPYAMVVRYYAENPPKVEETPLELSTRLARQQINLGETVELKAEVVNVSKEAQSLVAVALGIPAGLEVRRESLEAARQSGSIDGFEIRGREAICYRQSLAAGGRLNLSLSMVASTAGKYTGPASFVSLDAASKPVCWAAPWAVSIERK